MDRPFVIIKEMDTTIKQDLTELMDFFVFLLLKKAKQFLRMVDLCHKNRRAKESVAKTVTGRNVGWGLRNPTPCQGGGNCGEEDGKEGLGGATGIGTPPARQQETGGIAAQTLERGWGGR